MKRLSYILLAAMLVAVLAVSCTAEVIDDMGLVSVDFEGVRDNGSKGLTVAQATLDVYDSSISWTYKAYKNVGDNTPATGTQTKDNVQLPGGISSGKLTLSQGVWNFELFGYVNDVLVYQGKAIDQSINGKNATVQIKVSPLKNGENGTLVFAERIVVTDGLGNSFNANNAYVKGIDVEYSGSVNLSSASSLVLKSGSYNVRICCEGDGFTYAEANAVVTIYDGLDSVISGTLDENTAEAGFGVIKVDAAAGTTSQSQSITDSSEVEYKYGFSPASEGLSDTKTTTIKGSFAKTNEEESSSLELKVYDGASSAQRFTLSNGEAVIAGFDFTLSNATVNGTVEVSAYIGEGYTKEKLAVVYNGSDAAQPTIVSYDSGVLTFTTTHFSEYYVTTSDACVLNENTKQKYIYLQDAIDNASDGDTIGLLGDVVLENTVVVDKKLTLDLEGRTISNISDLWNESTGEWSLISVRGTGNLTITGNGTLKAKENDCFAVDVQDVGAILTIENGILVGNVHAVYVFEGSAYINGGTYSVQQKFSVSKPDEYVLNCYDTSRANGTAKIVVTGGKFENFNPADCYAEGAHTDFVVEGYISVKDEDGISYTVREKRDSDIAMVDGVVYSSLSNAINAAKPGEIVTMLCDSSGMGLSSADVTSKELEENPEKKGERGDITVNFSGYTYTMLDPAVGSKNTETQAMHWGISLKSITMKNGTFRVAEGVKEVAMAMQNYVDFTAENMTFDFTSIPVVSYGENEFSGSNAIYNGRECPLFNNNAGAMLLDGCTIKMPADSSKGISADGDGVTLKDTIVDGYVNLQDSNSKLMTIGSSSVKDVVSYFGNGTVKKESSDGVTTYTLSL